MKEQARQSPAGSFRAPSNRPPANGDGHTHERACLNCGAELVGDYCHACGQKAHVHRTIAAWWHDLVHGVLHLDGKIWRTLPMLAWRPGELTHRYVHGQRANFVSPLALFLFSVFLMFAVFSAAGAKLIDPSGVSVTMTEARQEAEQRGSALEKRRAAELKEGRPTAAIDRELAKNREEVATLRRLETGNLDPVGKATANSAAGAGGQNPKFLEDAFQRAKQNPSLLVYKLQTNAYKFSWALIPLSVPFLWLLFLHRRRYREQFSGYDHFVFITYSIAAMSLGLVLFVLLRMAGLSSGLVNVAFMAAAVAHIYRQLRGAYGLSRWSAAWRTLVLLWFAAIVLSLFGLMLLAIGVFG